jgi:hypothetical protein
MLTTKQAAEEPEGVVLLSAVDEFGCCMQLSSSSVRTSLL